MTNRPLMLPCSDFVQKPIEVWHCISHEYCAATNVVLCSKQHVHRLQHIKLQGRWAALFGNCRASDDANVQ